ncbi:MAG: YkgJ family cysteine cluster protein, partial [Myxococcota bacterium]|nr:YkgJ family cysteine cluster protein [Myxococcota bacterium]
SKRGRGLRCLAARRAVRAELPACERWEDALDCQRCAACCRSAFDTLLVGPRERIVRRHPALIVVKDGSHEMPRPEGTCAALETAPSGAGDERDRYACRVYDDRPRTCREFTRGSENCLLARQRVGLSR